MIRKYGDMGKCWSTYLKFCLERQTFMFHYPPSNKEAVLAHLREMITANEQLSGDFQSSCEMKKDQSNYMRISHTQANHTHGNIQVSQGCPSFPESKHTVNIRLQVRIVTFVIRVIKIMIVTLHVNVLTLAKKCKRLTLVVTKSSTPVLFTYIFPNLLLYIIHKN